MKKAVVFACMASVFLSGCGAGGTASQTADSSAQAVASELKKAEWAAVSTDAEAFHLNGTDSADFAYVMEHMDTVSLDRLIAFALVADGGPSEGACEELRSRFLESPHTVLAYLVLMGDQPVSSDDSTPAAELICGQIASADAAWHDGSEEFAQVMESCKADYPEGPAAELLSKMETAHKASLERNK